MSFNNNGASILLVDDMATNRTLVKHLLPAPMYQVSEACDGEHALDMLVKQSYDVVLLDIMMPGLDGFEVCQKIRMNPDLTLLPIIIFTTLGSPDDIAQGMSVGANDYICKPFNAVELKARVDAAVSHKRVTDCLDNTESVLFSLARMVEARDENTGNHCDRLSHMGMIFGKTLDMTFEEIEALRRGGILHDIGKLGIPDKILLKKGKLTQSEWKIMKQHTTIGAALCEPLRSMRKTVDIVSSHHERWNGSGYPQGLKGDEVPLLARVFQIVDIYDALSSERPYKPAFPLQKVLKIMEDETADGYWDPELMHEFLKLARNRHDQLILPSDHKKDYSAHVLEQIESSGVMHWYRVV